MSTFLALRCLSKPLRSGAAIHKCINPLKYKPNFVPAIQSYTTNSKESTSHTVPADTSNDKWRTIYHLPLIRLASAFNRVKIPYGIMNALIIPAAFALEQSAQLPSSTTMLVSAIGLTSWCTLAISSLFIRNLIGFVYVNDNNDKLKLAYVDYWGKRHDVCLNSDDVIPETGKLKIASFDFYQPVCLYSDNSVKYKLLPRFGRIDELDTFVAIFGE